MLHHFLSHYKSELIDLCKAKVALRRHVVPQDLLLESGIPSFLDQVIKTLEMEEGADPMQSREVSGPAGGGPSTSSIGATASRHGADLLVHGYPIEQVVHDYGDLCQSIMEIAVCYDKQVEVEEFRTLNRCLDNAIADAVKEYGYQRDMQFASDGLKRSNERMGFLAHELRNSLHTAKLALAAIKIGYVGVAGATGSVLDRCLGTMSSLVDTAVAEVRATAGIAPHHELFSLAGFIEDAGAVARLEAKGWECELSIGPVDPALAIEADRGLLLAALANLVQNAFKFTRPKGRISLKAYASGDRVLITVEDQCGGLPPGGAEKIFEPFTQVGKDKSGLGLGLTISKRSVEANNGTLNVRDIPGHGCVFTIDLPRRAVGEQAMPSHEPEPEPVA